LQRYTNTFNEHACKLQYQTNKLGTFMDDKSKPHRLAQISANGQQLCFGDKQTKTNKQMT